MDSNVLEVSRSRPSGSRIPMPMRSEKLDRANQLLDELLETGKYPAIQVCIRHRGEIVLERALGRYRPLADGDRWRPATLDTRFLLFSVSKCITATALHLLFDRGEICVDDPVHWYIPEFAQHGKKWVTLRHILTHTAGIPMIFWHLDDALIGDWDRIINQICQQQPVHFPGRHTSYHILSSGFLIGEVIRRVDGRDIGTFLRQEFLDPLEMETFDYGIAKEHWGQTSRVERVDDLPPKIFINLISRLIDVDLVEALSVLNRPAVYQAMIPAGNIVGTARETSRFFQMLLNGGRWKDRQILSERQVRRATVEQVLARRDWTLFLTPQRYSLGYMLGRRSTQFNVFGKNTEETFGHLGFTRVLGWANRKNRVAGAFLTNGLPIRPTREILILRRFQDAIRQAFS